MSDIRFIELTCCRCGGQLKETNTDTYQCESCGKTFEKQKITDVSDQLRSVLGEQKQEAVANLRRQLWAEMHEQYINSEKIVSLARDIKKYLPEDYFANFCEVANDGGDKQINAFLNGTPQEVMSDYADVVLDFMIESARPANLSAISYFIERAFKGDPANFDKYINKYECEAEKIKRGLYDLNIPRDVFLAYSSKDTDKVLELCEFLERNKISCFLALRNLRHGRGAVDNYNHALEVAIDNCKTVVFVSSCNSRDRSCDALDKELSYIKRKDIENAPAQYRRNYYKIPSEYLMPRVQYVIEDFKNDGSVAESIVDEFFHDLEWCRGKEEVARRITDYLTATLETSAQKAERENRELQQKLEEERRKAEEERRKAKELELKIAQAQQSNVAKPEAPAADGITADSFGSGKICKKCKKTNSLTANFCTACGNGSFFASYDEYLASKFKYCTACGAQNNEESRFCAACGSKDFVPTQKEYEAILAQKAEQERLQKLREEEERKRKLDEQQERKRKAEAERKRKEDEAKYKEFEAEGFYIKDGVLVKYKGDGGDVVIPDCVISIGQEAFRNCESLKSVTIPNGVTSIGDGAFCECTSLKNIIMPNSVTSIGGFAFSCCEFTSITIPNSVTSIGEYAFDCTSLNSIIIPKSVTFIGNDVFNECDLLEKIYCEAASKPENWDEFWNNNDVDVVWGYKGISQQKMATSTAANKSPSSEDLVNSFKSLFASLANSSASKSNPNDFEIKNGVLVKYKGKGGDVVIPDGVTSIGINAFYSFKSFNNDGSNSLKNITLPNSLTEIGGTFYGFHPLINITVSSGNKKYKSVDGNLYSFDGKTLLKYATGKTASSFIIPNGVTSIGSDAFFGCKSLTNITIPDTVISIGSYAFKDCKVLTNITIPNSVTSIGEGAFWGCELIKSIVIPNGVTSLSKNIFNDCISLASITIPNSVTSIGYCAFGSCKSLTSIIIPDSVTSIGEYAFNECSSLESIVIPKNVTTIDACAFCECSKLKTIYCKIKKPLFGFRNGFPEGWNKIWLLKCNAQVIWNYKGK